MFRNVVMFFCTVICSVYASASQPRNNVIETNEANLKEFGFESHSQRMEFNDSIAQLLTVLSKLEKEKEEEEEEAVCPVQRELDPALLSPIRMFHD